MSWFGLLTNVTSANIFLNVLKHPRPVVYCHNLIISFGIATMCVRNTGPIINSYFEFLF
jgi:hypothetical protein